MAYDFAKRKKKRKTRKKAEVSTRPVWFFTGLFAGLFLAFLLHLAGVGRSDCDDSEPVRVEKPAVKAAAPAAVATKPSGPPAQAARRKPRFEFYDVLPEQKTAPNAASKEAYKTRAQSKEISSYLLQAGSFAAARDAETRRANITLLNLNAHVEAVKLKSGSLAHRVYVGPFAKQADMETAKQQLASEGIETLLMTRK